MDRHKISLAAIDSASLALAFCLSIFVRISSLFVAHFGSINLGIRSYMFSWLFGTALLLIVMSGFKLYRTREIELSARLFTVLKALIAWMLIVAACIYALKFDFSRGVLVLTVILTAVLTCLSRFAYFRHRRHRNENDDSHVYMIGTGDRAKEIEEQIKNDFPRLTVIRLDQQDPSLRASLASLQSRDIFIADESMTREQVMKILADASLKHHSFRVVLDTFRLTTGEIRPNDLDEIPSISSGHSPHALYLAGKRLVDILVSVLGLVAALPLWIIISAAIRLDSTGPALIRQYRVGTGSMPFILYKFRTMRHSTVLYEQAPRDQSDSRITSVGRFLRRFSLDELPQLWNVFIGNMSLVGPRPEMEFIVKEYEPWQELRLKAKPGLTGLWQILGRKDIPLHENLEYDFYYVCNQNMFLDVSILLKTIPAVLFGRGAY